MRPVTSNIFAATAALLIASCGGDPAATPTVFLSGNAYVKGTPTPVAGGVVSIAEHPELSTMTDAEGYWSLEVPNGESLTPFLTHEDFVPTHTETFTTADEDIERVHFQMLAPQLFELFVAMLNFEPDPAKCQLSTEVTEMAAQSKSLHELVMVRPHGVPGVTVDLVPPSGSVTYFAFGDPLDYPDASLTETSTSGGLVQTQIDPGVYVLEANHASRDFESIVVTCEAGRFINATVPRGLHER